MKKQSHGTCALRAIVLTSKCKLQIASGRITPIQTHLMTQVLSQFFYPRDLLIAAIAFLFIFWKYLISNILLEFQEKALKLLLEIKRKLNDLGRICKSEGSIINIEHLKTKDEFDGGSKRERESGNKIGFWCFVSII